MSGQRDFMEGIRALERMGQASGNRLTMQEIEDYFSDMELSEGQLNDVCKYFEGKQIRIENRVRRAAAEIPEDEVETKADPLDQEMVDIYLKEMEGSSHLKKEQEEIVVKRLMRGDTNARNLLIEANLSCAVEIAGEYGNRGLAMSDLIQEANIGLMEAVNEYEPGLDGDFASYKERRIRGHIEEAIGEYAQSTRSAMKIASRINEMNDIATAFAREYEREAKPGELAERMGISEEEVRELMKTSLDAIAVLDQGKIG